MATIMKLMPQSKSWNKKNVFPLSHEPWSTETPSNCLALQSHTPFNIKAVPCENMSTCGQQRPRSACFSMQSDQSIRSLQTESLDTCGLFQWITNVQMKLCACARRCESAHFAHARRHLTRPIFKGALMTPEVLCNIKNSTTEFCRGSQRHLQSFRNVESFQPAVWMTVSIGILSATAPVHILLEQCSKKTEIPMPSCNETFCCRRIWLLCYYKQFLGWNGI